MSQNVTMQVIYLLDDLGMIDEKIGTSPLLVSTFWFSPSLLISPVLSFSFLSRSTKSRQSLVVVDLIISYDPSLPYRTKHLALSS